MKAIPCLPPLPTPAKDDSLFLIWDFIGTVEVVLTNTKGLFYMSY